MAELAQQRADRFPDLAFQAAGLDQSRGGGGQRHAPGAGGFVHRPQRLLADAAAGHVDDPLERQVVSRLDGGAHIGDGVADFGPFIEAQAADDAIRARRR